jgi:hypothetical protein
MKYAHTLSVTVFAIALVTMPTMAQAHRSGCHRWHSCPSDSGSYTCGDAGHPCQYPTYPSTGGVIYPPSGYYKDCYDCALKKVPTNAQTETLGIGWTCKKGYFKSGDLCKKLFVPANAVPNSIGDGWTCNSGYKRTASSCEQFTCVIHAHPDGEACYCDVGYHVDNGQCIETIIPVNAHLSGNLWECNAGYVTNYAKTGCLTTAEDKKGNDAVCSKAYPNTNWTGDYSEDRKLLCGCISSYVWSATEDRCETPKTP